MMKTETKRKLTFGLIAFGVLLLLIFGFWPRAMQVDVEAVKYGDLQVSFEEEGITKMRDRYVISAPVFGRVLRIHLKPGDSVKAGQTLAVIAPSSPELLNDRQLAMSRARLSAAEIAFQQSREQLQLAAEEFDYLKKEFERIEDLHTSGVGSDQQLDQARYAYRRGEINKTSAEFGVQIAEYEVESARAALQLESTSTDSQNNEPIKITSPIDGILIRVVNENERSVTSGEPLLEVGDPNTMEIRADVLSQDAVLLEKDSRAVIKRWGGDGDLEGYIRIIEPAGYTKLSALGVEEQRVPVYIRLTPNADTQKLGDGFRVVVEFISWSGENVLLVPTSALFRSGIEWSVFILGDDERVSRRTVEVGHRSSLYAELLDGLNEGELVLTHPDEQIEEGVRAVRRE